jgi:hypothetical protein
MSTNVPVDLEVTWEQIIGLARLLEASAIGRKVPPEDAARLVLMLLEFQKRLVAPVRVRSASGAVLAALSRVG